VTGACLSTCDPESFFLILNVAFPVTKVGRGGGTEDMSAVESSRRTDFPVSPVIFDTASLTSVGTVA